MLGPADFSADQCCCYHSIKKNAVLEAKFAVGLFRRYRSGDFHCTKNYSS